MTGLAARDPWTYRLEARRRLTPKLLEACRAGQLTLDQAAELHARLVVPKECLGGQAYLIGPSLRQALEAARAAGLTGELRRSVQPSQRRDRQHYTARPAGRG